MNVFYNRTDGILAENSIIARQKLTIGGIRLTANKNKLDIDAIVDVKGLTINGLPITSLEKLEPVKQLDKVAEPIKPDPPKISPYTTCGCDSSNGLSNLVNLDPLPGKVVVQYQWQIMEMPPGASLKILSLSIEIMPGAVLESGMISFDFAPDLLREYPLPVTFIGKRTVGCESVTDASAMVGTWFANGNKSSLSFEAELAPTNVGSIVFTDVSFTWI